MINLVSSFLDVSKIEQGTFAEEIQNINLLETADNVIKELEPQIKEKELNIIKEYDKDMPMLKVDSKLAKIILQNLISNAVQYTPQKGQINISIKTDGKNLNIIVADTGLGIPQTQQPNVFKKLFRAENVKKETKGSGLGLYMAKTLLERINGRIWFESKEGKGTTFFVSLPLS